MNYILIYTTALILSFSILGYGFLLSRIINKDLLNYNIGYQGLLGILFLTSISYLTIFFTKHGYLHNIIIHSIGLLSFIYFLKKKIPLTYLIRFISLFTILFIALLIIRNHDDFNYYHLTYSLGLTENKIFFGLGQFQHGYKHHSSLFFFNSIIFLPFIKYYLFHSLGWFTLVFVNYLILDFLLFKKIKNLNFEYYFYLLSIIFINIKFCRIGGYGTDLSGQMILLVIFPLIYSTLRNGIKNQEFKSNISLIILIISYATTLKSFFILNFIFLISFLFFFNVKKIINYFIFTRAFIFSSLVVFFLILVNFAYTGCALYPVKETCLSNELSWALEKKHVEKMNNWYQQWSKAGAGVTYRVDNPKEYIKKLNWVPTWYERYFLYKFKELIIGTVFLILLSLILFKGVNKEAPDKKKKKILLVLFSITLVLFFEWFYNHPALRYGGYYLYCILVFIPISYYLSKKSFSFSSKKITIISLIIFSFFIFYLRNIKRINEEFAIIKNNDFPLFFAPKQEYKTVELEYDTKVYIPIDKINSGCWAVKTPCVSGSDHVKVNKKFGYKIFSKK